MAEAAPHVVLIVMDTGPLITLAAAESLDYLRLPTAHVYIPDAVFYEATVKFGALGAQDIIDWVQANPLAVHIVPTSAYADAQLLLYTTTAPSRPLLKGLGERAALEVIGTALLEAEGGARGVLVTEDDPVLRTASVPPYDRRVIALTTADLLDSLEANGRINSADEVYRRAEDAGRYASRRRSLHQASNQARAAVAAALRSAE